MEETKMYSPAEAADRLNMSDDFVRAMVREGKLKAYQLGRKIQISEASIQEFLEGNVYGQN